MPSFFDNIGKELNVFFNKTIPGIGHDIGKFVDNAVGEVKGTVSSVWKTVDTNLQNITSIPKTYIQQAPSIIKSIGGAGSEVLQGASSITSSLSMPLAIGAGVAGIALVIMLTRR